MENAWANDRDRYVLAAQPGRVAGAARKSKHALAAHRPKRPARLRSPQQEPLSQVNRYYAAGPGTPVRYRSSCPEQEQPGLTAPLLGCSTPQGQHDRGGLPCHHSGIGATASRRSGGAPSSLLLVQLDSGPLLAGVRQIEQRASASAMGVGPRLPLRLGQEEPPSHRIASLLELVHSACLRAVDFGELGSCSARFQKSRCLPGRAESAPTSDPPRAVRGGEVEVVDVRLPPASPNSEPLLLRE